MQRRYTFLILACGLATAGAIAMGAWWVGRPSVLRIAVVHDSEDAQLVQAITQDFAKKREDVRLKAVYVNDAGASAAALEANNADMAVVRSDIRLPLNGQTLALLHRNAAILLAGRNSKIAQISDLRGRAIGIVRGPTTGTGNLRLFDAILAQYEIASKDVSIVELGREGVFEALSTGKVAAVMTVGALNTQSVRDVVTAATLATGSEPVFIPVSEAKAMALRAPVFEAMEIVRGSFGGSPPKPAESIETLGVSVRLMAANTMKDSLAGGVTRLLFSNRPSIAQVAPLANQFEAPSTDRGAAIPVHPGAAAYLDDEEETFFDRYSDGIYIGAMILSVLGSAAAAVASRAGSAGKGADNDRLLRRLLDVLRSARTADTLAALDTLEQETDDILIGGIAARSLRVLDPQTINALTLALDQARLAIRERRQFMLATAAGMPSGARIMPIEGRAGVFAPQQIR